MASFDISEAAANGYRMAWQERRYLVRLAFVPVMVKFICFVVTVVMGAQGDFIRQALICLPYYLAEGWLLAHVVRLFYLGQRWPFRGTGDAVADEALLYTRFRGVMAGAIIYALICFVRAGLMQLSLLVMPAEGGQVQLAPGMGVLMVMLLLLLFWAVRLAWLNVPAALNYPITHFLRALGGYRISFSLAGTWLICVVPLTFLSLLLVGGLPGAEEGAELAQFISLLVHAVVSTVVVIITTLAMAWGFRQVMLPEQKKMPPGGEF